MEDGAAAMNHLISRSIRRISSPRTLRLTTAQLQDLGGKGATDDSNFKKPTAVYIAVPIVTFCLGLCSLCCYLQWKRSLIRRREEKLAKVAQRRRRVSMKQSDMVEEPLRPADNKGSAASPASAGSAGASNRGLITPTTVASAPLATLGLVTRIEIVDKMILEYESLQCGASMPQQHLVQVDDKTYNVTINPLYNSLQSGACGYVRSGAEIKNKALAIAEEVHRRSTLVISLQNIPVDNPLPSKHGFANKNAISGRDDHAIDRRSLVPSVRESIKAGATARPISRLSQVSRSSASGSPSSPNSESSSLNTIAEQQDRAARGSSSGSLGGTGSARSSSFSSRDVGPTSNSSSVKEVESATTKSTADSSSTFSPQKFLSSWPSREEIPAPSGTHPTQMGEPPTLVVDSKSLGESGGTQVESFVTPLPSLSPSSPRSPAPTSPSPSSPTSPSPSSPPLPAPTSPSPSPSSPPSRAPPPPPSSPSPLPPSPDDTQRSITEPS